MGMAFGWAAATAEIWLNFIPFTQRRFGPGPGFFLEVAALHLLVASVVGLLLSPLLWLRFGRALHLVAMAGVWFGLEQSVVLESPLMKPMAVVPPIAALVLVALGLALARMHLVVPWAAGAILLAAGIAAPPIYLARTTPPAPARSELPPAPPDAPDVVLIVLDTIRAESLSAYGYTRDTSPAFDALAREGALFEDATAPSTWSLPAHASLFTGRWPSSHGAHAENRFLDARFPTLAQVLEANGYETFCITANAWISDGLGLTRGFAHQDQSVRDEGGAGLGFSFIHRLMDRFGFLEADKGGDLVVARFEDWARERPAGAKRPAFVFLNFIEAHFPYHQLPHDVLFRFTDEPYSRLRQISLDLLGAQFGGPSPPAEEVAEPTRAMYDGGIVHTDRLLGRVADALQKRGTLDDTVLVVLADHGEILGEHGEFFGHGPGLYQASVGVPLLFRYPERVPPGVRISTPVSTLSTFATIAELADLPPPPTLQAGSLAPLLGAGVGGGSNLPVVESQIGPILAELHDSAAMSGRRSTRNDPQMGNGKRYRLLREGDLKLIEMAQGDPLLYDLSLDPEETRDLSGERPEELAAMQARMREVQAQLGLPGLDQKPPTGHAAPELDEATREQLRALGYLE